MDKTEMMKRYEAETGEDMPTVNVYKLLDWYKSFSVWLEAKAAAYNRLMSGGKKTPKEVANFFGFPIAMNKYGAWYTFPTIPIIAETGFWYSQVYPTGRFSHSIPTIDQIDFNGDWKNSITLPDGWEEE